MVLLSPPGGLGVKDGFLYFAAVVSLAAFFGGVLAEQPRWFGPYTVGIIFVVFLVAFVWITGEWAGKGEGWVLLKVTAMSFAVIGGAAGLVVLLLSF